MAITRYAGDYYVGLSTDTKPTNILEGARFLEKDTAALFFYDGSTWTQVTGGGSSDVVDDTSPQLGGTLDANGFDIDLGNNHLLCNDLIAEHNGDSNTYLRFPTNDQFSVTVGGLTPLAVITSGLEVQGNIDINGNLICNRIAEHDLDTNTYIEFPSPDQFSVVTGGGTRLQVTNTAANLFTDIDMNSNHLLCDERIAEHTGDSDTHIDFTGSNTWSVTVGNTEVLKCDLVEVLVDHPFRSRARVVALGTGAGTTTVSTNETGTTYYATTSTFNTRSIQLNSASIGTQVEVHANGAGTVRFIQGSGQTIIQGNPVVVKDKSAMVAKCVATNTWSVVGGAA